MGQNPVTRPARSAHQTLLQAHRDLIVVSTLVGAMALLIWSGSEFVRRWSAAEGQFSSGIRLAAVGLCLNVALILIGWRRYADLQHENERRIERAVRAQVIASTDGMTGLLNRKGFGERGAAIAAAAAKRRDHLVILALQLSRFKAINDRFGYDIGDAVLRRLSDALEGEVPAEAALARLGGGEFAVLVAMADPQEAMKLAKQLLRRVTTPIEEQGKYIQVGAFVGLSSAAAHHHDIPDLLRRADIAMDHAKSARSARPMWFDSRMERELIAQSEIEQGIRFGLDHDQFLPYFEPQVDLATGRLTGFEVLARWDHPLTGIIGPDRFIAIAEEHNLIARLSDQVVRKAFVAAAAWDPALTLSINISPRQFTDSWLAQKIVRLLAETGFAAERLVVEVTESSLFADIDLARTIVESLKNQGIALALDDFGSGFSSLSHLSALPFDKIKIDRSFVASISKDRQSAAIVRAVTTMAHALEVPVVAEGIEDAAAHGALLEMGCASGQGWYFGKPMTAEDVPHLLRQNEAQPSDPGADAHQARRG